jgi:TPR repeat protein
MLAIGSRALARITALALILGLFASADAANAAEAGRYAPENIEQTNKQMRWLCMIAVLCPVSDDVRIVIKRAIEGKPSAEYLLGLTLLTGDGLPRDESAGIAWTARAAEHGDPDAARDIADRLRNGASIDVDETKIAAALKPKADAGDAEAMRALGPMVIRGRGVKQDPALGLDMMKRAVEKGSTGAANDLAALSARRARRAGKPSRVAQMARGLGGSRQCRSDGHARLHVHDYAGRRAVGRA